jgi:hypothetical protein
MGNMRRTYLLTDAEAKMLYYAAVEGKSEYGYRHSGDQQVTLASAFEVIETTLGITSQAICNEEYNNRNKNP